MQEGKLRFKSPRLANKQVQSIAFSFDFDKNWDENTYLSIQGKECRMNWTGSWSAAIGDRGIREGIGHYKIKIKKSLERHQLIGYICAEEKHKGNQGRYEKDYVSRNLLFSQDGSTRTYGLTKFMKRQVKQGDTLDCVCDMTNGFISWVIDETKQVIAQAVILPQFRGKEMIPYIYLEDIGDLVEIAS